MKKEFLDPNFEITYFDEAMFLSLSDGDNGQDKDGFDPDIKNP